MKRYLARLLSLLLMLCMVCPTSLAETAEETPTVLETLTEGIRHLFVHRGDLYGLSYFNRLYRKVEGGWLPSGSYPDEEYNIAKVFNDGENIWFLTRKENEGHEACYQIIKTTFDADGNLTDPESPVTIDWPVEPENWPDMAGLVVDGDQAYILTEHPTDWEVKRLYRVDLSTGESKDVLDAPLETMIGYKGGLLGVRFDWNEVDEDGNFLPWQAVTIDPATGDITQIGLLKTNTDNSFNVGGLTWDQETNTLYFCDSSHVYRMNGDEPEIVGYLAPSTLSRQSSSAVVYKGRYYVADIGEPNSGSVDPSLMPQKVLRVQRSWSMDDQIYDFAKQHPDIAVEYVEGNWNGLEEFTNYMQSDYAPDVYTHSMDSDFITLRDKKYLVDMSSSQVLMDAVSRMYPHLTAELLRDGQLFALPVEAEVYSSGYFPIAFEKAGVPLDMVPKTFGELMDFIVTWYNDYFEDNEGMELIQFGYVRNSLYYYICEAQELLSQSTGTLTYDTPTMRALLNQLDEITPILQIVCPDNNEDGYEYIENNTLFTLDDNNPLIRVWYLEDYDSRPMPLALDDQTPPVIRLRMDYMAINPYTENTEAAFEFMEYLAEHQSIQFLTTMCPDQNEPIEAVIYEQNLEFWRDKVAKLEDQLESASEDEIVDLQDELEWTRTKLAQYEANGRWAMTTEDILWYRENIAPYLTLSTASYFSTNAYDQMLNIRSRYIDGQLTADEFVQEMDRIVWMVQMERQ